MPIAYHGRSSSIIVSGTDITRPKDRQSWMLYLHSDPQLLDFELEMGFLSAFQWLSRYQLIKLFDHIFGMVLVNDWSARIFKHGNTAAGAFLTKNLQPQFPHGL
jgi:fumarylacetoacetase